MLENYSDSSGQKFKETPNPRDKDRDRLWLQILSGIIGVLVPIIIVLLLDSNAKNADRDKEIREVQREEEKKCNEKQTALKDSLKVEYDKKDITVKTMEAVEAAQQRDSLRNQYRHLQELEEEKLELLEQKGITEEERDRYKKELATIAEEKKTTETNLAKKEEELATTKRDLENLTQGLGRHLEDLIRSFSELFPWYSVEPMRRVDVIIERISINDQAQSGTPPNLSVQVLSNNNPVGNIINLRQYLNENLNYSYRVWNDETITFIISEQINISFANTSIQIPKIIGIATLKSPKSDRLFIVNSTAISTLEREVVGNITIRVE